MSNYNEMLSKARIVESTIPSGDLNLKTSKLFSPLLGEVDNFSDFSSKSSIPDYNLLEIVYQVNHGESQSQFSCKVAIPTSQDFHCKAIIKQIGIKEFRNKANIYQFIKPELMGRFAVPLGYELQSYASVPDYNYLEVVFNLVQIPEVIVNSICVKDTFTLSSRPTRNFGEFGTLTLNTGVVDSTAMTYIQLSLDDIRNHLASGSGNLDILSLDLVLFAANSIESVGPTISLYEFTTDWGEYSLTWANQPSYDSLIKTTQLKTGTLEQRVDLKDYILSKLSTSDEFVSFYVTTDTPLIVQSRESLFPPMLQIVTKDPSWIGIPGESNLNSKATIIKSITDDLLSRVNVFEHNNLQSRAEIVPIDSDLDSTVLIKSLNNYNDTLRSRAMIIQVQRDFQSTAIISYGRNNDLRSKVRVLNSRILSKANINWFDDLQSKANIYISENSDLQSRSVIPHRNIVGHAIIKRISDLSGHAAIFGSNKYDLQGKADITYINRDLDSKVIIRLDMIDNHLSRAYIINCSLDSKVNIVRFEDLNSTAIIKGTVNIDLRSRAYIVNSSLLSYVRLQFNKDLDSKVYIKHNSDLDSKVTILNVSLPSTAQIIETSNIDSTAQIPEKSSLDSTATIMRETEFDLLSKATIMRSANGDLLGTAELYAINDFNSKVTIIISDEEDIFGKIIVKQSDISNLSSVANLYQVADLMSKAIILRVSYSELMSKATIMQSRSSDLDSKADLYNVFDLLSKAKIAISDISDLLSKAIIKQTDVDDLLSKANLYNIKDLLSKANIAINADKDLNSKVRILQRDDSDLDSLVNIYNVNFIRSKVIIMRSDTNDLLSKAIILQNDVNDFLSKVNIEEYIDTPSKVYIKHNNDFMSKAIIYTPEFSHLLSRIRIGLNYIDLILDTTPPQDFNVTYDTSEDYNNILKLISTTSDVSTINYEMIIWGNLVDKSVHPYIGYTESDSQWIPYSEFINLTMLGPGVSTLHVKIRDDVWNETGSKKVNVNFRILNPKDYFELELDTTPPQNLEFLLNGEPTLSTYTLLNILSILTTSEDTLEAKIWGDLNLTYNLDMQDTEGNSNWIPYVIENLIKLSSDLGLKYIYIKLRDDVWNETGIYELEIDFTYKSVDVFDISESLDKVDNIHLIDILDEGTSIEGLITNYQLGDTAESIEKVIDIQLNLIQLVIVDDKVVQIDLININDDIYLTAIDRVVNIELPVKESGIVTERVIQIELINIEDLIQLHDRVTQIDLIDILDGIISNDFVQYIELPVEDFGLGYDFLAVKEFVAFDYGDGTDYLRLIELINILQEALGVDIVDHIHLINIEEFGEGFDKFVMKEFLAEDEGTVIDKVDFIELLLSDDRVANDFVQNIALHIIDSGIGEDLFTEKGFYVSDNGTAVDTVINIQLFGNDYDSLGRDLVAFIELRCSDSGIGEDKFVSREFTVIDSSIGTDKVTNINLKGSDSGSSIDRVVDINIIVKDTADGYDLIIRKEFSVRDSGLGGDKATIGILPEGDLSLAIEFSIIHLNLKDYTIGIDKFVKKEFNTFDSGEGNSTLIVGIPQDELSLAIEFMIIHQNFNDQLYLFDERIIYKEFSIRDQAEFKDLLVLLEMHLIEQGYLYSDIAVHFNQFLADVGYDYFDGVTILDKDFMLPEEVNGCESLFLVHEFLQGRDIQFIGTSDLIVNPKWGLPILPTDSDYPSNCTGKVWCGKPIYPDIRYYNSANYTLPNAMSTSSGVYLGRGGSNRFYVGLGSGYVVLYGTFSPNELIPSSHYYMYVSWNSRTTGPGSYEYGSSFLDPRRGPYNWSVRIPYNNVDDIDDFFTVSISTHCYERVCNYFPNPGNQRCTYCNGMSLWAKVDSPYRYSIYDMTKEVNPDYLLYREKMVLSKDVYTLINDNICTEDQPSYLYAYTSSACTQLGLHEWSPELAENGILQNLINIPGNNVKTEADSKWIFATNCNPDIGKDFVWNILLPLKEYVVSDDYIKTLDKHIFLRDSAIFLDKLFIALYLNDNNIFRTPDKVVNILLPLYETTVSSELLKFVYKEFLGTEDIFAIDKVINIAQSLKDLGRNLFDRVINIFLGLFDQGVALDKRWYCDILVKEFVTANDYLVTIGLSLKDQGALLRETLRIFLNLYESVAGRDVIWERGVIVKEFIIAHDIISELQVLGSDVLSFVADDKVYTIELHSSDSGEGHDERGVFVTDIGYAIENAFIDIFDSDAGYLFRDAVVQIELLLTDKGVGRERYKLPFVDVQVDIYEPPFTIDFDNKLIKVEGREPNFNFQNGKIELKLNEPGITVSQAKINISYLDSDIEIKMDLPFKFEQIDDSILITPTDGFEIVDASPKFDIEENKEG